ncbi:MAG: ABC-2 transporter permease [Coriobacteriia bacterium]|nr:ABC-2 transporter permease [Coriobacteriia bacterium]
MKGLIFKDLFASRRMLRTALYMTAFFLIYALMMHSATYISAMAMMFLAMLPISSFAQDDLARWNAYAVSLPVTRTQIVLAKYVLAILLALLGGVIGLAMMFAAPMLGDQTGLQERLMTVWAILLVALLFMSVMIPLIYRFSVEKSRVMLIAVLAVPTLAVYLLNSAGVPMPTEATIVTLLRFSPFILALILAGSAAISCRIFAAKEL